MTSISAWQREVAAQVAAANPITPTTPRAGLTPILDDDWPGTFTVEVAGHSKELSFDPRQSRCGRITDGVSLKFADEGCWVIALSTLKSMVAEAEAARAAVSEPEPASDAHLIERKFARAVQIEGKCPAVSDENKRGGA